MSAIRQKHLINFTALLIFLLVLVFTVSCEQVHVQTFNGIVGAENFTYYKLTLEGHVIVKLQSIDGDADLYLSTESMKPTWDDYTMKSDTCSDDIIVVHTYHKRPIGIGIYGYLPSPVSVYRLSVYLDPSVDMYYPESKVDENQDTNPSQNQGESLSSQAFYEDEEESLLWSLFVGFLKLVIEILF